MKLARQALFVSLLAALCLGSVIASAQQAAKPLSDKELLYLLEKKVSSGALTNMVESYGVTFQLTDELTEKLRKAGADARLIETIQQKSKQLNVDVSGAVAQPGGASREPIPAPAAQRLEFGQRKLKALDFEGALQEFAEAEKLKPKWDQVYYYRGLALEALGQYQEAAVSWRAYLSLVPPGRNPQFVIDQISAWEDEAAEAEKTRALLEQGEQQLLRYDAEGAATSFGEAVRLSPTMGTLLAHARAQLLRGNYAALDDTARQALALDPHSALARLYIVEAKLQQGKQEGLPEMIEEALTLNPHLAYGRALLCRVLHANSRTPLAGGASESDTGPNAGSAEERNRMGWVLWNGGQLRPALEELQKAALLDPGEARWQCDLAYAREARGDRTGALVAAREAVRLDSGGSCGRLALAVILDESGSHEEAVAELQAAVKASALPNAENLIRLVVGNGR